MSDERQEKLPVTAGRHLAPDGGASRPRDEFSFDDDSPFVDTSFFDAVSPAGDAAPDDDPFPDASLLIDIPLPDDEPRPAPAPRRRRQEPARSRRKKTSKASKKDARRAGESRAVRRRRKVFRTFIVVYLIILGLGTGYLQLRLWLALDHSQKQMDQAAAEKAAAVAQEKALYQAPQRTFEQWLDSQTGDYWADLWYASHQGNDMEPRQWLCSYFEGLFASDDCQAYKAEDFTSTSPVYLIKSGQTPVARVRLTGSGLNWSVSNVELLLTPDKSCTITVPRSCRVTFNGKQLDAQSMQPVASLLHYDSLRELLQEPVSWVSYTADGLISEPEITVEPPKGCKVFQSEDGAYMLTMDADVSRYTDMTERFTDAFLAYYMNGYHDTRYYLNELLSFVYSDTQAFHDIYSTYDSVSWSTYYRTKQTEVNVADEAIVWANNCFSIDVSYVAKGTVESDEVVPFADATMRVYFLREEDGYYISHFEAL